MANNLTGDYEGVFLIRLRQINGILATLHHNRVDPISTPSFPHSARVRVGSSAILGVADAIRFQN